MSVGVAWPGVELPARPLYIGLLPDELALGGPPGPASQELAPLPPC